MKTSGELIATAQAVLVELEGCLLSAAGLTPGARDLVTAAGARLVVMSNDSTRTAEEMSAELALMGLDVPVNRIVLAGVTAVNRIAADRPGARLLPLVPRSLCRMAHMLGLVLDETAPDVVLVGRDQDLTWDRLDHAVAALAAGAEMVVCGAEPFRAGPDGRPLPQAGALAAALNARVPRIQPMVVDLSEPELLRTALARLDASPRQSVFIAGESRSAAAAAVDLPFLVVRSGRSTANLTDLLRRAAA